MLDIQLITVEATFTAVVRARVQPQELSKFVPAACGEVWQFVRSAKILHPGRHTALYLEDGTVEVGVEVPVEFAGTDRIHCSRLPAGRVAAATHLGAYSRLGETHARICAWCAEQGHRRSGPCWEVYGHWEESWNAEPGRIRTDVFHLLSDEAAPR